jgi:DNA-binding LytR/AlgR family response regulator
MKLKCIITDDEPIARRVLAEFIQEIDYLELIGQAENPLQAMTLMRNNNVDLLFLDINMPKINGIDFLKVNRVPSKIVMTTAYAEYAVEAFGLDVVDYLLKPIAFDRFVQACNKVRNAITLISKSNPYAVKPADHFFVKCDGKLEKIYYDKLIYVEAKMNYVMLYTESQKYMVYLTIGHLEEQLPADLFIRVHKSYIVNKEKVKTITGNLLDLGIAEIAISHGLKDQVVGDIVKDQVIKRL